MANLGAKLDPGPRPLRWILGLSLVALVAIRLYGSFCTVKIWTWDDVKFRKVAIDTGAKTTPLVALAKVVGPNDYTFDQWGHKPPGYHAWLTLAASVLPAGLGEGRWEIVNLILFALQGACVYLLCRRGPPGSPFPLFVTFLYLSTPIVFGMSRWVMTENHAMAGMLVVPTVMLLLLENAVALARRAVWRALLAGALAGWVVGLFSGMREYALPTLLACLVCTVLGLAWQRAWWVLAAFAATVAPYLWASARALEPVLRDAGWRAHQEKYFHPLVEWIPHAARHSLGIPMTAWLVIVMVALAVVTVRRFRQGAPAAPSPEERRLRFVMRMTLLALSVLPLFYVALLVELQTRTIRASIPILGSWLVVALFWARLAGDRRPELRPLMLPLCAVSWVALVAALFMAPEGGKKFGHHAFNLEIYNYPMGLRELRGPNDRHITR